MRNLYDALLRTPESARDNAAALLEQQLENLRRSVVEKASIGFPKNPHELPDWLKRNAANVAEAYSRYLQLRGSGAPRLYFENCSQALFYLQATAPTKLVEGAELYGSLYAWRKSWRRPLAEIYLQRLGHGNAAKNHTLVFQHLLRKHDCEVPFSLNDGYYLQGTLQLALGHLGDAYLPEALGFTIGYAQLPLPMLVAAYELTELNIDPDYLYLQVSMDNADIAQKAASAVIDLITGTDNAQDVYRRVKLGYRLGSKSADSLALIESFDLDWEVRAMLERKRQFALNVHSDHSRIGGKTVNEWLASPEPIDSFLNALLKRGWIRRHNDPRSSHFWNLIAGERGAMFGVFTAYEKQLMYDWIAGTWRSAEIACPVSGNCIHIAAQDPSHSVLRAITRSIANTQTPLWPSLKATHDEDALIQELEELPPSNREQRLITLARPGLHATPGGLLATRLLVHVLRSEPFHSDNQQTSGQHHISTHNNDAKYSELEISQESSEVTFAERDMIRRLFIPRQLETSPPTHEDED